MIRLFGFAYSRHAHILGTIDILTMRPDPFHKLMIHISIQAVYAGLCFFNMDNRRILIDLFPKRKGNDLAFDFDDTPFKVEVAPVIKRFGDR